jgi:ABC-type multidrug transport system fused ATPase/permease subunit
MKSRAESSGKNYTQESQVGLQIIDTLIDFYREIYVKDAFNNIIKKFEENRIDLAKNMSRMSFNPYIVKFYAEGIFILGLFLVTGLQLLNNPLEKAVVTVSIYLFAGSRIAPSILRIQQSLIQIKANKGLATSTLNFILSLPSVSRPDCTAHNLNLTALERDLLDHSITLEKLTFAYGSGKRIIEEFDLEIKPGESIAVVGQSGIGKSTLADLVLGILHPSAGSVKIGGLIPGDFHRKFPGSVAYIPQEVNIFSGTVLENITLGLDASDFSVDDLDRVIEVSQLSSFISRFPKGLETVLGDKGIQISGGQKQRLGIARALLTKPRILVLDESTSALDGETELRISRGLLESLTSDTILIVIAHRLSTIRDSDRILYFEADQSIEIGTFDELREKSLGFRTAAETMGL